MWSEPTTSNRRTGIALLLVAVLLVSSVGPVLAAPRVFVASADLEQSRAVTGESVNVSFELRNTGDPGAAGIEVTVNGSAAFHAGPRATDEAGVTARNFADGTLDPELLVTSRIELEDIVEDGFERLVDPSNDEMKVLVRP